MPELSITESQQDRLDQVRQEVERAYVGAYGETRPQDAIEYLLDTYTPPEKREIVAAYEELATATYPTLQRIASDVEGVPGSGIEAAEMRGRLLAALGPEKLAEQLREPETDSETEDVSSASEGESDVTPDPANARTIPAKSTEDGATVEKNDEADSSSESESDSSSETESESPSETSSESSSESQSGSPPTSPLATVNKLLDDHREKWRKGEGDAPYEVDLPDGTTKAARTKDDVRQLLFRHY